MKIILCPVLFSLSYGYLCEPAWAADSPVTMSPGGDASPFQYTRSGSIKIDKASFDAMLKDYPEAKLRVLLTDDSCLAKMEAAMRAMDLYLNPHDGDSFPLEWLALVTRERWVLWQSVKRDCWGQP